MITTEKVNHPNHYGGDTTYEAIKVIEAWELEFCLGNTVKYICRAGKKDTSEELEDLKKAAWYLNRRITQISTIKALPWCNCTQPIALVVEGQLTCRVCGNPQRVAK